MIKISSLVLGVVYLYVVYACEYMYKEFHVCIVPTTVFLVAILYVYLLKRSNKLKTSRHLTGV